MLKLIKSSYFRNDIMSAFINEIQASSALELRMARSGRSGRILLGEGG